MQDGIKHFLSNYSHRFTRGASAFLATHGQNIVGRIQEAIRVPRSTVYIFGNGGCHAIAKCMEYALYDYASLNGLPIRVQTGLDIHRVTWLRDEGSPGIDFVKVLKTEGADFRDVIVLLSGSGDSDNLCEAATFAKRNSIPILALIGSNQGKLRGFVSPTDCFCVPLRDQQISEDIIQALSYFLGKSSFDTHSSSWGNTVHEQAFEIGNAIRQVRSSFIDGIAKAIVRAFNDRNLVWVIGLDQPILSICAEHTAHNLYWDGIYKVNNPPPRLIRSSPTACDLSGISNDRHRLVLKSLTEPLEDEGAGVVLIFSMGMQSSSLLDLLDKLDSIGVPAFVLCGGASGALGYHGISIHESGIREPHTHASFSQAIGHVLGRIVRMRLLEQSTFQPHTIADEARFLIDFDLAQRRLLDA